MAKFIFKMENILKLKTRLEDIEKNKLISIKLLLEEEESKLKALNDRIALYNKQMFDDLLKTSLNIEDIKFINQSIEILKYSVEKQQIVVDKCRKDFLKQQDVLKNAMIDKKTYEKLKEKAFEKFWKEELAKEQKEIDELVSYKYNSREEN